MKKILIICGLVALGVALTTTPSYAGHRTSAGVYIYYGYPSSSYFSPSGYVSLGYAYCSPYRYHHLRSNRFLYTPHRHHYHNRFSYSPVRRHHHHG